MIVAISDQQYRHDCAFLDEMCACRPHEDTPEMRDLVHQQAVRLNNILHISPLVDEATFETMAMKVNQRQVTS